MQQTLEQFWGYSSFRILQEDIIKSVLQHRDTLALLPTGAGKSLCYQLPALLMEGVVLVISPLLALMKEQVNTLNHQGIPAGYLSSEFDEDQEEQIYQNLLNDDYKIFYISPERLLNRKFMENIADVHVSLLAVDEAHCISEWGSDFRPSYQNIAGFRENFKIPCLALTATASYQVMDEIQRKLKLEQTQIFRSSYKRSNLYIHVREVVDKYQHIYYFLKNNPKPGLIYVRTRKQAEDLTQWLTYNGIQEVDYYHAGLKPSEKYQKQQLWQNHSHYTLVATTAFGMGIDKEDVGFVLHLNPPPSIENYYQEIGRAGRNGEDAETILLWNENELKQLDDILSNQLVTHKQYKQILSFLYSICRVAEHEQPEEFFEINTYKIQKTLKLSRPKLISVLSFLHNQELIFLKKYAGPSSLKLNFPFHQLESLGKNDSFFLEKIARILDGAATHKVYFKEENLAQKMNVHHKDLKLKLRELQQRQLVEYFDGSAMGIRFLTPRNDKELHNRFWKILATIQKNKMQKWEEMKYFLRDQDFCKMKMILAYFGENETENCGVCSYCLSQRNTQNKDYKNLIFESLMKRPMTLDELSICLKIYPKDEILAHLKILLNKNQVKMLDFKTYSL